MRDQTLGWLEGHDWKGVDPFDGLLSPFVAPFATGIAQKWPGSSLVRLAALQAVKRSPINLRPALRIPAHESAMSLAVGVLGLLTRQDPHHTQPQVTVNLVDRMLSLRGEGNSLWGYAFPWQARAFFVPKHTPNLVISSICIRALCEALENPFLGGEVKATWCKQMDAAVASLESLFWKKNAGIYSYVEDKAVLVHNANLFGIESVLSLSNSFTNCKPVREEYLDHVSRALKVTLEAQDPSGRWSYGAMSHHQWCDNFHTAYNLVSLCRIRRVCKKSGLSDFLSEIDRSIYLGTDYYLQQAFTEDGACKYYDRAVWPIETHSAAAAFICLKELSQEGFIDLSKAAEIVGRTLLALRRDLYLGEGQFAYRKWPRKTITTVFTRWTQAWIYWGLECAVRVLEMDLRNHLNSSAVDCSPHGVEIN